MTMSKKFIESLVFFVLSILLLVVSSLAWFASYNKPEVGEIVNVVGKYALGVKLEVKTKDSEEYFEILDKDELTVILENSIPADTFAFRLTIENQGSSNINVSVHFKDLVSIASEEGYDMFDVFYIVDGKVEAQSIVNNAIVSQSTYTLNHISDEPKLVDGVTLDLHRFSNLKGIDEGRILLLSNEPLLYEGKLQVFFTIMFDTETENPAYEVAEFSINTIEIFMN